MPYFRYSAFIALICLASSYSVAQDSLMLLGGARIKLGMSKAEVMKTILPPYGLKRISDGEAYRLTYQGKDSLENSKGYFIFNHDTLYQARHSLVDMTSDDGFQVVTSLFNALQGPVAKDNEHSYNVPADISLPEPVEDGPDEIEIRVGGRIIVLTFWNTSRVMIQEVLRNDKSLTVHPRH